jgi:hypothetical protein
MSPAELRRRVRRLPEAQPLTRALERSLSLCLTRRDSLSGVEIKKSIGWAGFATTTEPDTTDAGIGTAQRSLSTITLPARRWFFGWAKRLAFLLRRCDRRRGQLERLERTQARNAKLFVRSSRGRLSNP